MGDGRVREFGMDTHRLLYLKWITSKDLLQSGGSSAPAYVTAWMGGEFRGEWIHVCVWIWIHVCMGAPLLFSRNYHKVVNQVYPRCKLKIKKKKIKSVTSRF